MSAATLTTPLVGVASFKQHDLPPDPTPTRNGPEETAPGAGYSFSSSTIVRVAIAAGIIVIAMSALVVFMKVRWG